MIEQKFRTQLTYLMFAFALNGCVSKDEIPHEPGLSRYSVYSPDKERRDDENVVLTAVRPIAAPIDANRATAILAALSNVKMAIGHPSFMGASNHVFSATIPGSDTFWLRPYARKPFILVYTPGSIRTFGRGPLYIVNSAFGYIEDEQLHQALLRAAK